MSLRFVHLLFILLVILGADLFGAWSVWQYVHTKEMATLWMGVVSVLGGVGLIFYALKLVRAMDAEKIR